MCDKPRLVRYGDIRFVLDDDGGTSRCNCDGKCSRKCNGNYRGPSLLSG